VSSTNIGRDLERRIPRPDYLSSFFCTSAAQDGLYDLDLFTSTGVLDKMPEVHDAISAGVRALQALEAGIVCFYGARRAL
jgi:hypothetical protein